MLKYLLEQFPKGDIESSIYINIVLCYRGRVERDFQVEETGLPVENNKTLTNCIT